MSYTIADRAIADAVSYLGDQVIARGSQAIEVGELTTRKQVRLVMWVVGLEGITVDEITDKYWPTLPA